MHCTPQLVDILLPSLPLAVPQHKVQRHSPHRRASTVSSRKSSSNSSIDSRNSDTSPLVSASARQRQATYPNRLNFFFGAAFFFPLWTLPSYPGLSLGPLLSMDQSYFVLPM